MKNMDDELEDMRESYDGLQQKQELYGIRIRAKLKNREMIPAMFDIFSEYLNKNGIKRNRMTGIYGKEETDKTNNINNLKTKTMESLTTEVVSE